MRTLTCAIILALSAPTHSRAQAPPTVREMLARRGIGISREELMQALRSPDPEVRSLAGGELAEQKNQTAIPAIVDVLERARDPSERLNLAYALQLLRDPRGEEEQVDLCNDASAAEEIRILAAGKLTAQNDTCLMYMADVVRTSDNVAFRSNAFHAFGRPFVTLRPGSELRNTLVHAVEIALSGDDFVLHRVIAEGAAQMHLVEDQGALEQAAQRETNPDTRVAELKAIRELSAVPKD